MSRLISTWSDLEEFYSCYPSADCMLKLVHAIQSSPYTSGLFAWQSHLDLNIVQTDSQYPYDGPYLRIRPLNFGQQVDFRYIDTPDQEKQWHCVVEADAAFQRLEKFVRQLNWFTHYAVVPNSEREETR